LSGLLGSRRLLRQSGCLGLSGFLGLHPHENEIVDGLRRSEGVLVGWAVLGEFKPDQGLRVVARNALVGAQQNPEVELRVRVAP
jgi:hypothetical protein